MIEIKGAEKLTDFRWLNLFKINYLNKQGNSGEWIFASRKKEPKFGTDPIPADAVVVIPLLKQGRKRKLVAIKEFRIPLGDYEWAVPAGLYDHNETAETCAKRELKEETGLKMTKVLYVGPSCVSSAGLSDESVVYVVCECTGEVSTDGNEGTEDIEVKLFDVEDLIALRKTNEKISAKALPFFLMFEALKKVAWPNHMKQETLKKPRKVKTVDDFAAQQAKMLEPTAPPAMPG